MSSFRSLARYPPILITSQCKATRTPRTRRPRTGHEQECAVFRLGCVLVFASSLTGESFFPSMRVSHWLSAIKRKLITDKVPFKQEGKSLFILISQITDEENPLRPTAKNYPLLNVSHEFCWPIMQACWRHSPKERITSRDAYKRLCEGSPSPALN